MELPRYRTIERAEHAVNGFIRTNSSRFVPSAISSIVSDYFGYFFLDPNQDPSNFITEEEIQRAIQLKQAGNKLCKEKKYTQAIEKYTESLSNNPNDGKLHSNRCLCYLKINDFTRAFVDAKASVHLEPAWHKSWLRLAQTLEAMQRYSECFNIIGQALDMCEYQNDKQNKKLLDKYLRSVIVKSDTLNKEEPINHMNDEDRLEWKYCELCYQNVNEGVLSDDVLLELEPYRIATYLELIMPKSIAMKMVNSFDGAEYERWLARKWISKCNMYKDLNVSKRLTCFTDFITLFAPVQLQPVEVWSVSWSAQRLLHLNKRLVMITIHSSTRDKIVHMGHTYCKPNAHTITQCVKRAIIYPLDAVISEMVQRRHGVEDEDITYSRRPLLLNVQ